MADSDLTILLKMVDKTSKPIGNVGKALGHINSIATKVGASLTKNLTLPILAIGAASLKVFSDFESGMANVSTLVDTTTESMSDMSEQVQDIASRTPVAFGELTSALFDVRSASIPAADAMNVLERSAQLGVAGLGSTAQAARLAAGAINAWGLEGEDADRIFNTIFQTTKNGITTIAGLEQGFGAVAGKMAKAGLEADDYFASVAALTTTTLKASEAHTQMKAAIDGLEKSGKKTKKIFQKLGVKDFKELVKTSGGVTQAFRLISEAAGKQSGALKALIGSSEGAAAVQALAGAQGDKQIATLADMRKETIGLTDVQKAANKQFATSASKIKMAKNQMVTAGIKIGAILAPAILKLTEKVSDAVKWFGELDNDTKRMIVTVAGVLAVVGPSILIFAKMATAIGIVTTAIKLMTLAIITNPIGAAVAIIAGAAGLIITNWDTIGPFFKAIWGTIEIIFENAAAFINDIIDGIMAAVDRVKRAAGDIKAHFSIEQTSGERAETKRANIRGAEKFFKRTGRHIKGFGLIDGEVAELKDSARGRRDSRDIAGAATEAIKKRGSDSILSQSSLKAAVTEKNEIVIRIDGPGEVASKKGPSKIDVRTGRQGAI